MTVYVDEVRVHPNAWGPFRRGSCHMTADDLGELHAMAQALGMPHTWFQSKSTPHYDLTPERRRRALALGAVFRSAREQARERVAARKEASPLRNEERELLDKIAATLPLIESGATSEERASAATSLRVLIREVAFVRGMMRCENTKWKPERTR